MAFKKKLKKYTSKKIFKDASKKMNSVNLPKIQRGGIRF